MSMGVNQPSRQDTLILLGIPSTGKPQCPLSVPRRQFLQAHRMRSVWIGRRRRERS